MSAPTINDHCRIVLGAISHSRVDLLHKALLHLTPDHFVEPTLRNIYVMLQRYADHTGHVFTRASLADMLRNQDAGRVTLYQETYDSLLALTPTDSEFAWSLHMIRDLAAERATSEAITIGTEIATKGWKDEKSRLEYKGHEEARRWVQQQFALIDKELSMQESPEGDIRGEGRELLVEYADRKAVQLNGGRRGVMFGIPGIDLLTGGLQPGELWTVAGYSGEGKTTLCCGQLAWDAAVAQGLNVYIATTETIRVQVRRKLLCRHSRLPMFGLPDGINSHDLKNGTLPPEHEAKLQDVVSDFTRNPAYGKLHVAQVARGTTISQLEARLRRVTTEWMPDLVVVDYFALFRPETKRQSTREELGDIYKEAKMVATSFNDGKGVPLVSPWQTNRSSRDEAARNLHYTLKALAETAESVNSSDGILTVLAPDGQEDRRRMQLKAQLLKNRDGETANDIDLQCDYATSYITEQRRGESMDILDADMSEAFTGM